MIFVMRIYPAKRVAISGLSGLTSGVTVFPDKLRYRTPDELFEEKRNGIYNYVVYLNYLITNVQLVMQFMFKKYYL